MLGETASLSRLNKYKTDRKGKFYSSKSVVQILPNLGDFNTNLQCFWWWTVSIFVTAELSVFALSVSGIISYVALCHLFFIIIIYTKNLFFLV